MCSLNWMFKKNSILLRLLLKFTQLNKRKHFLIVIHWQQWDAYSELTQDVDGLGNVCGLLAQDVDGHGTICSLLFVRLPWIRDIYEHELFNIQTKWVETWVVQWIYFKGKNKIQGRKLTCSWLVGWQHYWVKHPRPKSRY